MLEQNNAVRNLPYDVEIRSVQTETKVTQLRPTSFILKSKIVTEQPPDAVQSPRIPLPMSTFESMGSGRTYIPKTGYDFLSDLPSLHIEQTFELNDSHTSVAAENRYIVRSPLGEAIYGAAESSTENNRFYYGSARPFQLHLLDKTHQEAMVFNKKLSLGFMLCQPCKLDVWIPPGDLLGCIVQSPTFLTPEFFIEDGNTGQPLLCVEGPRNSGFCCFCPPKDSFFKVHSGGDLRASIDHKWLMSKGQFTTNVYFSDASLTAKERALILATAFLLEYKFFQN